MLISGNRIGNNMSFNEKTIKTLLKTNVSEIRKIVDDIPKDKFYSIRLKDVKIGYIMESHNVSVSYETKSEYAHIKTDYFFLSKMSYANIDEDARYMPHKFLDYKSALNIILTQIPEECHKYVEIKVSEDTE